ncbi:hypothetical protein ACVRXX_08275 [Streptococcus plurextorum]|nr:hypothetical protein [Streptococcus plurextorum]
MVGTHMLSLSLLLMFGGIILFLVYFPESYAKSSILVKCFLGMITGISLVSSAIMLVNQLIA